MDNMYIKSMCHVCEDICDFLRVQFSFKILIKVFPKTHLTCDTSSVFSLLNQ